MLVRTIEGTTFTSVNTMTRCLYKIAKTADILRQMSISSLGIEQFTTITDALIRCFLYE